jgi:TPR repeat protein
MYLSTRYHIRILAGLSLSLAATFASAGEGRSYQLVDLPRPALAPADAYLIGRLLPEEQPAAQQPTVQQLTVQQTLDPQATEESQPAQHAQSSDGETQREAGDRALARDYQSAADAGDPVAMGRLGVLFQQGIGLPQSYTEAIKWYTRAAEAGNAEAMNNLGTLYVSGHGVPQDYAEAKKWYQRAADAGSVMAMINIAKMYYLGVGVARSYPEAANWFRLASIRGSAMAMNSLSLMYDSGMGVSQDRSLAVSLVKEAARLGYGPAMANLGAMYETGDGVESNHVEAYAWIGAALRVGVPNEAREALFYRLGAISARLNTQELARAQQLAGERSSFAPAAEQPVSGSGFGDRTSRLNH